MSVVVISSIGKLDVIDISSSLVSVKFMLIGSEYGFGCLLV